MMDKKELIARVAEQTGLSKRSAAAAVNSVFQVIGDVLAENEQVRVYGFGTFEMRYCAARTGRDPRTKTPILIPARMRPAFCASDSLKQRLR